MLIHLWPGSKCLIAEKFGLDCWMHLIPWSHQIDAFNFCFFDCNALDSIWSHQIDAFNFCLLTVKFFVITIFFYKSYMLRLLHVHGNEIWSTSKSVPMCMLLHDCADSNSMLLWTSTEAFSTLVLLQLFWTFHLILYIWMPVANLRSNFKS